VGNNTNKSLKYTSNAGNQELLSKIFVTEFTLRYLCELFTKKKVKQVVNKTNHLNIPVMHEIQSFFYNIYI